MKTKTKHGGSRPGAGAPIKEPTKVLTYRVPLKHASALDAKFRKIISSMSKSSPPVDNSKPDR